MLCVGSWIRNVVEILMPSALGRFFVSLLLLETFRMTTCQKIHHFGDFVTHSHSVWRDSVNWINSEHNYSYRIQLICYLLNSIWMSWMVMIGIGIHPQRHKIHLNVRTQYSCGQYTLIHTVICFCFVWLALNDIVVLRPQHILSFRICSTLHVLAFSRNGMRSPSSIGTMITAHRYWLIWIYWLRQKSVEFKPKYHHHQNQNANENFQATFIYAMRIENWAG